MTTVSTSNVDCSNGIDVFSSQMLFANSASIYLYDTVRVANGNPIINTGATSGVILGNSQVTFQAVSVDALTLGGIAFGAPAGVVNTQFFTANGTWTKPSGLSGDEQVLTMMWGAGGGSNFYRETGDPDFDFIYVSGGGGGGCLVSMRLLSSFAATEAVVVGQGGRANNTSAPTNLSGGSSTFSGMTAYGGYGPGSSLQAGGGGGLLSLGSNSAGGSPLGGISVANTTGTDSTLGGGGGAISSTGVPANLVGGRSVFGGGGGAYSFLTTGVSGAFTPTVNGGISIYGGAGGTLHTTNVTSVFAGNTGRGGGSNATAGLVGANGAVQVWVIK